MGAWLATRFLSRRAEGHALDPHAVVLLGAATALSLGSLWLTDVRHSIGLTYLVGFWQSCIPSGTTRDLQLADRFLFGWYDGRLAFVRHDPVPDAALIALKLCFALGVIRVLMYSRSAAAASSALLGGHEQERNTMTDASGPGVRTPSEWGTRSQGGLLMVIALLVAAPLIDYPICAGRLT